MRRLVLALLALAGSSNPAAHGGLGTPPGQVLRGGVSPSAGGKTGVSTGSQDGMPSGDDGTGAVVLLGTGSMHGDEVPVDAEGEWLALVRDGDTASVRPVDVSLEPEEDIGDRDGQRTGRRVLVSPPVDPVVLLRGLPPATGPVTTVAVDADVDVGRDLRVSMNSAASRVSVRCREAAPIEGQRQERCDLALLSDSAWQALVTYRAYFEAGRRTFASGRAPQVVWAGDLDFDGRLDLLVDTSDHDNVHELRLFLSSRAQPGRHVAEVARFTRVGC